MASGDARACGPLAARIRAPHERYGSRAFLRPRLQTAGHGTQTTEEHFLVARCESVPAAGADRCESTARREWTVHRDVLHIVPGDRQRDRFLHSVERESA